MLFFLPRQTRKHLMAACRQNLLALRGLLDAGVRRIERRQEGIARRQAQQPGTARPRRGRRARPTPPQE